MRVQKLFEPMKIGTMLLKNRLVMPAMDTTLGSRYGFVTSRLVDYSDERFEGGVCRIIVEYNSVDYLRGKVTLIQLSIDDDKYLEGLSELAGTMRQTGGRSAI